MGRNLAKVGHIGTEIGDSRARTQNPSGRIIGQHGACTMFHGSASGRVGGRLQEFLLVPVRPRAASSEERGS